MSEDKAELETRSRQTIMDGDVIMIATAFNERKTTFGVRYNARGPFEVSASRNAVIVHRANCSNRETIRLLMEAIRLAETHMERLVKEP